MSIHLYNTFSRKKEEFKTVEAGKVKMYNCGPTVYHYVHIGNLSSFLMADLLRRFFEYRGYDVIQVKNITDVGHMVADADSGEDKMEKAAKREKKDPWEIAKFYEKAFLEDEKKLKIKEAHYFPRATEHIQEMISIIEKLIEKGHAYVADDGVYFDISTFPNYGQLSGNTLEDLQAGARIEVNPNKKNPMDFAIWKLNQPNHIMQWDSPWGRGFPGWHIECTAMSTKYLGESFDIHTGGEDNIFPHHESEIAQSEAVFGHKWVNFWLHKGRLNIDGEKMSKSLGNFFTIKDLEEKNIDPMWFRYLVLASHYRSKSSFSFEAIEAAKNSIERLNEFVYKLSNIDNEDFDNDEEVLSLVAEQKKKYDDALDDDLDTPKALAAVFELVKEINKLLAEGKISKKSAHAVLEFMQDFNKIFDVLNFDQKKQEVDDEILALVSNRNEARENKDYKTADKIRDELLEKGYELIDEGGETRVKFKL